MVSLKYALIKEDFINYYTYITWDAPENKKKRRNYYLKQLSGPFIFFLSFYYFGLFDRMNRISVIVLGLLILLPLLSLLNVKASIRKQAEKIADEPENASFFFETDMHVSDTGIHTKDKTTEVKYNWNAFIRKQENDNYYFLFYSQLQAIIIPKTAFNTPNDKLQFENLLSQHLSFDAELNHLLKS